MLTHTPPLANYCLSLGHSATCAHVGFCTMCLVEAHIRAALSPDDPSALAPETLVHNLHQMPSFDLDVGTPQDAHELLLLLLAAMEPSAGEGDVRRAQRGGGAGRGASSRTAVGSSSCRPFVGCMWRRRLFEDTVARADRRGG